MSYTPMFLIMPILMYGLGAVILYFVISFAVTSGIRRYHQQEQERGNGGSSGPKVY
ncbi:hypothetical protein GCM10027417_02070 [Glutamicibacter endophyticus]|uniref:hypothetical protein n=1 Tax=Glutamicibacter sp. PS TaxID=3075634 RepID=UPI00284C3609|nr:hypothetical protein [Glutamicibacter sp. PS]MDR4532136.1 hypothetical protein [Glutamicibacter sp. PS]